MHTVNVTARTTPIKRSSGRSAVAAAAYRAGEKLFDERQSRTANYVNRSSDVFHSEILVPDAAPEWMQDRHALWNGAEAAERRKDARTARELTLGLPWDMTPEEHREAVTAFAEAEFVEKGHVADICLHKYGQKVRDVSDEGKETLRRWAERNVPFLEADEAEQLHEPHVKIMRNREGDVEGYKIFQPHAHVMITTRAVEGEAFATKTNRSFNSNEQAEEWRLGWADHINERLERAGYDLRVSTSKKESDEALPLAAESLPLDSYSIEQRGETSTLRDEIEFNKHHNETVRDAAEGLRFDEAEEAAEVENGASPDAASGSRFARMRAWFSNAQSHFSEWRDHWRERASAFFGRSRNEEEPEPQVGLEPNEGGEPEDG